MTKKVTGREANDGITSRGTVKGHHARPGDDVVEGGVAPAPKEDHGAAKSSVSTASAEGAEEGADTSTATVGKQEKEHAAEVGAMKTQSGRGHRKTEE